MMAATQHQLLKDKLARNWRLGGRTFFQEIPPEILWILEKILPESSI